MASIQQIDANRRNSQRSTGPVTPEGKRAASTNALKSGIYAEALLIPGERAEDLQTLTREYHDRFHPTTPEARDLVDSVIRHSWLLRRLAAIESAIFNCTCPNCTRRYDGVSANDCISDRHRLRQDGAKLDLLQRRVNATERNYHRSLKALQALQPAAAPLSETDPHPEPRPEAEAQPADPKPVPANLASFRQTEKSRIGEAGESLPGARISDPESPKQVLPAIE